MNLVLMIGRLTRDPEMRTIQSTGNFVTRFSIAVDRSYKGKDGITADFFNVTVFGRQAETCNQYLGKGRLVAVRGRLQNNNYETKTGEKRYTVDIVAEQVQFLDFGDNRSQRSTSSYPSQDDVFMDEDEEAKGLDEAGYKSLLDEDVPFS